MFATQPMSRPRPSSQRGATLVVALVLLSVLMLSGLAAMYASNSQLRISANLQYQASALIQAENAAAAAESWLATGNNFRAEGFDTYSNVTPHLYPAGYLAANGVNPLTMAWTNSNSAAVSTTPLVPIG